MTTTKKAWPVARLGLAAATILAGLLAGGPGDRALAGRMPLLPAPEMTQLAPGDAVSVMRTEAGYQSIVTPALAFPAPTLAEQHRPVWIALLSGTVSLLVALNLAFLAHLRRAYSVPRRSARRGH